MLDRNRSRNRSKTGDPFSPVGLFVSGAQGAWYDPSDFSTLFQDSAGSTPVTAVEQPVGLMLDRSGRGNHALQATSASRPVLRARYNLLTRSEEFDNAGWSKITTTVTANTDTAPDGTLTADTVAATGANSLIYQVVSGLSNNTSYTLSIWVKTVTSATTATLAFYTAGGGTTIGSQSFTTTGSWQRVTLTATTGTLSGETWFALGGSNTFATGETFYIWGAQLLTAADQTATGGAYQRIAAATDYDVSNPVFRPYLAFDGVDDFMSLASAISITTDMTVVRGFGRASAGIVSVGIGDPSDAAYDALWAIDNKTYLKLGGTTLNVANGSTSTDYFVISSLRNGTNQFFRRNGTQISSVSAPAVSGTLPEFGRRGSTYNNGPIYGLIVLDRELTGSELTATEQWMAGKTGATLA